MVWLPRNAQKCIFFTPLSPFLAKKIFFSKIRLRQFFGTIESYLDTKNQKKLWSGSSGIHPDGRTDGRTHESKSIVPPKFFGSVQKLTVYSERDSTTKGQKGEGGEDLFNPKNHGANLRFHYKKS